MAWPLLVLGSPTFYQFWDLESGSLLGQEKISGTFNRFLSFVLTNEVLLVSSLEDVRVWIPQQTQTDPNSSSTAGGSITTDSTSNSTTATLDTPNTHMTVGTSMNATPFTSTAEGNHPDCIISQRHNITSEQAGGQHNARNHTAHIR